MIFIKKIEFFTLKVIFVEKLEFNFKTLISLKFTIDSLISSLYIFLLSFHSTIVAILHTHTHIFRFSICLKSLLKKQYKIM